jgi:hypothetical protein
METATCKRLEIIAIPCIVTSFFNFFFGIPEVRVWLAVIAMKDDAGNSYHTLTVAMLPATPPPQFRTST